MGDVVARCLSSSVRLGCVRRACLPSKMRESLVGFSHLMGILSFLYCIAFVIGCSDELRRQFVGHCLLAAPFCILNKPTDCKGLASFVANFDRYLIISAADASRFNFERRLHIIYRFLKNFQAGLAGTLLYGIDSMIKDFFRRTALPFSHDAVHKLRHQQTVILWIWKNLAFVDSFSA